MRTIEGIVGRCIDAFVVLGCAMLGFQVLSIGLDVLLRNLFDTPLSWVIYLNEWTLLYIAFLGAAWLQRDRGHVRIDSIVVRMPPRVKAIMNLVSITLALGVSLLLVWFGTAVTLEKYLNGIYDFFKIQEVPVFLIYIAIPIGSVCLLIQLVLDLAGEIRSLRAVSSVGPRS